MTKYSSAAIIEFAVKLQRGKSKTYTPDQLVALLYHEFPGLSNIQLREAIKDVQLLLAIRKIMREDKE